MDETQENENVGASNPTRKSRESPFFIEFPAASSDNQHYAQMCRSNPLCHSTYAPDPDQ